MIREHKIMDSTGHSVVEFDDANTVEVGEAMRRFEALTGKGGGHTAATRAKGDADYVVARRFEDTKDETLFIPPMQGG